MDKVLTSISKFLKTTNIIVLLVIVIVVGFVIFIGSKTVFSGSKLKETSSGTAKIIQAYAYITAWSWDSSGGSKGDTAVLQYSPMVNISTTKEIKKFEIRNVKLTNDIEGKYFITWPKHVTNGDSNTLYEPMNNPLELNKRKNEGNSFSYKIVDSPRYRDEVSKTGGIADFKYTIWGLGNKYNYENLLNSKKSFTSGKALEYAGLRKDDVNSPIEFDVVITFVDNNKAVKHFSLTNDFAEIYEQGFSFKYNEKDYIGKEF